MTQEPFLTRNAHISVSGVTSALVLSHGDLGLFVRQSVYPTISPCHRALDAWLEGTQDWSQEGLD